MTTEDAFQSTLDAEPWSGLARRVFADWLEEQGDARAAGMRALGELGLYPDMGYPFPWVFTYSDRWTPTSHSDRSVIPQSWYEAGVRGAMRAYRTTRREADDAAALAFARLSAAVRAEILAGVPA
jgi:uncharacterized protein (TIGR02996 family)